MWLFSEIRSIGDIPRHYARVNPEKAALVDASGALSFHGSSPDGSPDSGSSGALQTYVENSVCFSQCRSPSFHDKPCSGVARSGEHAEAVGQCAHRGTIRSRIAFGHEGELQ